MDVRFLTAGALAALLLVAPAVMAEDEEDPNKPGPWNFGAITGINLSQSAFSDNWAGGDEGTITWVLSADLDAERQFSRKFNWNNVLQLAYGQTSKQETGTSGSKSWSAPDKSTDKIQFESLGRFTLGGWADPYVGLRLDSQFLDQRSPFGQLHFNPIKIKESGGIARVFK
ncbi:MAG: DUF3078 domain-containing protein, partial [Gemmatimonadetes bacterium]|nr:DUF3078 domain-containing protein [Gemmatimonadota bacterium]